jgi:tetratricopeptide (TPR) repeat protein
VPVDVAAELRAAAPGRPGERMAARLAEATRAYEADRYLEASQILRELTRQAAGVAAVREIYGLTLYRMARYAQAEKELRAAAALSGSVDQYPVLMDCARAEDRFADVETLWSELRRAGASSDVLAEGRLVMAGALADAGRVEEGIALLEPAVRKAVEHPRDRHVRQWYALADLYERSAELPKARELFARVVAADPELSDAAERLAATR